ncbi:hypothetical protein J0383_22805 [Flavobacterium endoglycinae]|uniref:DUF6985 domain-containing protein n=1 Tax=Flavobacterium endoglycinae TaxID=2816357 RepID=A0ABX7QDL6_9FLAO|nr:hypothetical protein [Flavobacterium endoglycinae]QSW89052.1 hypothetical protein J0383_22805 [Flavobacterium endoglycinae]
MKKYITSNIIGKLYQNTEFSDWWESEEIKIPLLNNEMLKVTFLDVEPEHDETFIEEADEALTNFLRMNIENRNSLSELAYNNCIDFLDSVEFDEADEPLREIKDKNEIWNFIYPDGIHVSRRTYNDKDIYISIVCECEWEQEHGLQLVFRQGKKLTRISDQDGHLTEADAYAKPDSQDKLLNEFNIEYKCY